MYVVSFSQHLLSSEASVFYIDADLLMACRCGCHHLHQMASIRDTLAIATTKCIVHAFVTLRIGYGNVVMYGMSGSLTG